MPTEFVRVRDTKTKTESSLPRRRAEQLASRGDIEILAGQPAANAFGEPLPASTPDSKTAAKNKEQNR